MFGLVARGWNILRRKMVCFSANHRIPPSALYYTPALAARPYSIGLAASIDNSKRICADSTLSLRRDWRKAPTAVRQRHFAPLPGGR